MRKHNGTKAQFIKKHPDLPAAELVKLAKQVAGITTTVSYIHSVRSASRSKPKAAAAGPGVAKAKPVGTIDAEDLLYAAAAELGMAAAVRLLEGRRAAILRVLTRG